VKRLLVLSVVFAIIVAACTPATSEPDPTDPPQPTTTSGTPDTTAAPTTTAPPIATTSTIDPQAELEEAKTLMTQPELAEGGSLEQNGAFAETTEGFTPFEDLEVLVYDDGENLNFYIEGPADLIRELVIEFDALDANGALVRDTSYVGDLAVDPPSWAIEAENGNTVRGADYPPPGATASGEALGVLASFTTPIQASAGDRLGVLIASEITTLQEFEYISIWIYGGLRENRYSYANYLQLYVQLLDSSSAGVIVAELFRGLLGPAPPPAAYIFFGD